MKKIRIAIIGMGLMGTRHAQLLSNMDKFELVGMIDENITLEHKLHEYGVPLYNNVEKLISITKPHAVIIATPNQTHLKVLEICTAYKIDVLIEKPISDSIESSNKIIELSNSSDCNILIGHHRRYNNLIQKLRSIIISGEIGNLVAVSAVWGIMKPKDYFVHEWRKNRPGGEQVLINLIHEIGKQASLIGFKRLLLFNAHGGQIGLLETAARQLRFECPSMAVLPCCAGVQGPS